MKKLFSILAVFAFVVTGGILLTACGGQKKYTVHFPENLEEYGIEHIYADVDSAGNCVVSKESKNIYFRFMPRYDYDPDTLTVNFKNSAGQDVEVSNFEFDSYNDSTFQKTYYVTVEQPQEITITLEGKAKIETRTFNIDPTLEQVTEENKKNLRLSFEVGDQSTGDLTYEQFETMLETGTNGNKLFLLPSQELDFGTQIKVTIWNTEHLNFFEGALLIVDDQGGAQSGLEVEGYEITSSGIKCTSKFTLEENRTLKFAFRSEHFEDATFSNTNILRPGYIHCEDQALHTSFEVLDAQGEKITILSNLLEQNTVSLQMEASEFVDIGYIAKCVKEEKFDQFSIVVDGREVSGFTVKVEERVAEGDYTIYRLIFENVPVNYAVGSKLPGDTNVELFKVIWKDYQAAMDADFVVLPKNFEFGQGVEECINGCLDNPFTGASFPIYADDTSMCYALKTDKVLYGFFFKESALETTFKITVGNDSQEITLTSAAQALTLNGEKITITYNPTPTDEGYQVEGKTSMITIEGDAQDFSSTLKIELA